MAKDRPARIYFDSMKKAFYYKCGDTKYFLEVDKISASKAKKLKTNLQKQIAEDRVATKPPAPKTMKKRSQRVRKPPGTNKTRFSRVIAHRKVMKPIVERQKIRSAISHFRKRASKLRNEFASKIRTKEVIDNFVDKRDKLLEKSNEIDLSKAEIDKMAQYQKEITRLRRIEASNNNRIRSVVNTMQKYYIFLRQISREQERRPLEDQIRNAEKFLEKHPKHPDNAEKRASIRRANKKLEAIDEVQAVMNEIKALDTKDPKDRALKDIINKANKTLEKIDKEEDETKEDLTPAQLEKEKQAEDRRKKLLEERRGQRDLKEEESDKDEEDEENEESDKDEDQKGGSGVPKTPFISSQGEPLTTEEIHKQKDPGFSEDKVEKINKKLPPLYDWQIINFINAGITPEQQKQFTGVFSRDELDTVPKNYPQGFVLNTDVSDGPGKHWIGVYIDPVKEQSYEVYCPHGDPVESDIVRDLMRIIHYMKLPNLLKFKYNTIQHQDYKTMTCGYHCVRFLVDRFRQIPWRFASGFDVSKKSENEVLRKFREQIAANRDADERTKAENFAMDNAYPSSDDNHFPYI